MKLTPKDKGLIKGCFRRVFSRSELRRQALESTRIEHKDINRPRVTKWSFCNECGEIVPSYLMQVDHKEPVIPLDQSLEDLSFDTLVSRMWCNLDNLAPLCIPCHKEKSKSEGKIRRELKKRKS